ncbi:MAG: AMP-binding protein [Desulfovibrio sp.]|nr:AMP-binding protein [Desulfovibrio sp.]
MAFQDILSLDIARVRGCCIHVVGENGRCLHNSTSLDTLSLYRSILVMPQLSPIDQAIADELGIPVSRLLPETLWRIQWQYLRETFHHAKQTSAFYAKHFQGIPQISSRKDWENLPLLTANDLSQPEALLGTSQSAVERMVTLQTSGTTGSPKRIALSTTDLQRTQAFFAHGLSTLLRKGDRLAILLPGSMRPMGLLDLITKSVEPLGINVLLPNPAIRTNPQQLCAWIFATKPTVLLGAPSLLQGLLPYAPTGFPHLSGILASTEPLEEACKVALAQAWHCEILNHYGLTEIAYGLALECPAHQGMHLRSLDCYVECIDPITHQCLPKGCVGEILITTLQRKTMPLIRYRTGDIGFLRTDPCGCGSLLPRLGAILGRLSLLPNGGWQWIHKPKGHHFGMPPSS